MPNPNIRCNEAVDVLRSALVSGLPHPGDESQKIPAKVLQLPVFRGTGIPSEMADHFAAEAGFADNDTPQLTAEAAVFALESAGLAIIPTDELAALRTQAADAPDGKRTITAYCQCDAQRLNPLMRITIDKTNVVVIPGANIRPCSHGA